MADYIYRIKYGQDGSYVFPSYEEVMREPYAIIGGDLTPECLLAAYQRGAFPYYSFKRNYGVKIWSCPKDRFVIFPDEVHVSHSMRTLFNKNKVEVSFNECFHDVICQCAVVNDRIDKDGAWLGEEMVQAYIALHEKGFAQSVEAWEGDRLIGGLYGVTLGGCFFGESMFTLAPNGSKIALIGLALRMRELGWRMIDCQFETPHLLSMGGRHISYADYLRIVDGEAPEQLSLTLPSGK